MILSIGVSPESFWVPIVLIFGGLIAAFTAWYGFKAYKLTSNKRYFYFTLAFILLSLELIIFGIVAPAIMAYYRYFHGFNVTYLLYLVHGLNIIFVFSTLMAYSLFILIYSKLERLSLTLLVTTLILSLAGYSYYLAYIGEAYASRLGFNLVSIMLLSFIILYAARNYAFRRSVNSLLVLITFIFIGLGHVLFVFDRFSNLLNLYGFIIQLVGYITLFIMFLRINYGQKKKQV